MDKERTGELASIPGTVGYDAQIEDFVAAAEAADFDILYGKFLHLLPAPPARILDVGAGTGRDAARFAAMGYQVVAAEPVDFLRARGRALHPSPAIDWRKDWLPGLHTLTDEQGSFEVILCQAVWNHLCGVEQVKAMLRLAALVAPAGTLLLTLRHGPVPHGKSMYPILPVDTIAHATQAGFVLVSALHDQPSALPRKNVTWTRLAFRHQRADTRRPR